MGLTWNKSNLAQMYREKGKQEGKKEGKKEGIMEGKKEGKKEGIKKIVNKQLIFKFGKLPKNYLLPVRDKGESCPYCEGKVQKIKVSGRGCYICSSCKKK